MKPGEGPVGDKMRRRFYAEWFLCLCMQSLHAASASLTEYDLALAFVPGHGGGARAIVKTLAAPGTE